MKCYFIWTDVERKKPTINFRTFCVNLLNSSGFVPSSSVIILIDHLLILVDETRSSLIETEVDESLFEVNEKWMNQFPCLPKFKCQHGLYLETYQTKHGTKVLSDSTTPCSKVCFYVCWQIQPTPTTITTLFSIYCSYFISSHLFQSWAEQMNTASKESSPSHNLILREHTQR